MKVLINNRKVETETSILSQLVNELSLPAQGIVVAVSNHMVLRMEWTNYALSEGVSIVIIKTVCGE